MRRTLIIIAIVIVLAGLGVVAYFYFFQGTAGITTAPSPTTSTNLPTAGQGTPPAGETTATGAIPTTTTAPSAATPVTARLVKISAGPVVPGEAVVNHVANASSSPPEAVVNFVERQSGNVFTYSTLTQTLTRTSNKTIPGIQSASWLPNASTTFVRYLSGDNFSTINTYALPANGANGFFLPQNLAGIGISPTGILTLTSGVNGSSVSVARLDGTHSSELFTTPLSSIRISFAGKNQYLVYTKPSGTLDGDAFLVDGTGHFSRIAGPLSGLVALASPSGKWVLVSYVLNGAMQMELVNTTTGVTTTLPVATIADKCVWTNNDAAVYCGVPVSPSVSFNYPDDWYQGAVHFSDRIWKVDIAGRYAQLVLDFTAETKVSLDAESPAIDALQTTLVFVNKNDGSLWSYSL
ncbi:MAG: hypothetical protein NUV90_01995 [Candidatus Parcubacteria bacterium]|nr:hypothetical protein [Candidatus Parcubacteria bacterium]